MKFEQLIAKYVTGALTTSQLPQIAYIGIEEGLQSQSLDILAGLEKNENPFIIEQYFNSAIKELGFVIPKLRTAAIKYAIGVADEIIKGERDIILGVSEIKNKAIDSYDFFSESKEYVYDSIFFEKVYGIYYECDDLTNDLVQIGGDKSRVQLITEARQELLVELVKWKEKILDHLQNNTSFVRLETWKRS
jgi:hypothetical protein